VDVGRFKSEHLAERWRRRGTPLSARALGHVHGTARWASRAAPLANAAAQSALGRRLTEWVLGIDRRRRPPRWTSRPFATRLLADPEGAGTVALFNDTFTNYFHPEIGVAAAAVLRAAGRGVRLAPNVCCGRPLISQGLLDAARALAAANADRLHRLADAGVPIVFLEPSCLSALREDAPALLRGDAARRARGVADRALLFENYLENELAAGALAVAFKPGPASIVLHGHCHQKAMGLLPASASLMARIPGSTITTLDAGCCGMAGSFGYMRRHYDVSRAIAERRLLPEARRLGSGGVLVASGTSCRHQVADFAGMRALHAAELLEPLVAAPPTRQT
jgi:Fe-S oxidoreductase